LLRYSDFGRDFFDGINRRGRIGKGLETAAISERGLLFWWPGQLVVRVAARPQEVARKRPQR
jgi:hypothetical protein